MKFITLLLLVSFTAQAGGISRIEKDQPAKHSGYLITEDMEQYFRKQVEDLEFQKNINKELTDVNTKLHTQTGVMQSRIDNLLEQNTKLIDKTQDTLFSKIGLFLLGAAATTLITFGVSRSVR